METADLAFCCQGCAMVYQILQSQGLGRYYDLQGQSPWIRSSQAASPSSENYAYLEDPDFLKDYAEAGAGCMEFYLEGVHCAACLWLVEKLPEHAAGVESAELDLGKSVAKVRLKPGGSFAQAAETLASWGYKPHALRQDGEAERLKRRENRSLLTRLGVAAACTGNLMLMSVSLYGGAKGGPARLFEWISFLIFLPVLFYSAVPFYQSCLSSWRTRQLSIDVPVMLAVLVGSLTSIVNLLRGSDLIYFDSLSALVFLLLVSRYLLRRIQQGILNSSHLLHFLAPSVAKRWNAATGAFEESAALRLKVGDLVLVEENEAIPADGLIRKGRSAINQALLNGESLPLEAGPGDAAYAGTVNLSAPLEIEVTATGNASRLGKILREIESGHLKKASIVQFADRLSKWFVGGVLGAAALVLLYFASQGQIESGLSRALALIIVTCPCTLAFATPLALSLSLENAARKGVLIKGADILEKLTQSDAILLDKTGTLTEGRLDLLQWLELSDSKVPLQQIACALESKSRHPIAQALKRHFQTECAGLAPLRIENLRETLGRGVEGEYQGHAYEIRAIQFEAPKALSHTPRPHTRVGLWRDGQLVAQALLGDSLRNDAKPSLAKLQALGLRPFILSGDNSEAVRRIGEDLRIPCFRQWANVSPEGKLAILRGFPKGVMVGDGANDAMALSSAFVGVAVQGSMEVSLRAADVYLSQAGLQALVETFEASRETLRVVKRNFAFSLFYNLVGGTAAILGFVHPLVAAVLMPISSLSVLSSSLWGTRKLRQWRALPS